MKKEIVIFWHRRDLRTTDNAGLYFALKSDYPVLSLFIFDTDILNKLEDKKDLRVQFIYEQIVQLKKEYQSLNSDLWVDYGTPIDSIKQLIENFTLKKVFANEDYEPDAQNRDEAIQKILKKQGIAFSTYKDHCIFEKDEVLKADGTPYTVFTPYAKKWKEKLNNYYLKAYPNKKYFHALLKFDLHQALLKLEEMGFERTHFDYPGKEASTALIRNYALYRDYPAMAGTSKLGIHLRFGTISIREMAQHSLDLSETFLNELIWRDFYRMILYKFPHVVKGGFKPAYDKIKWRNNEHEFNAWCTGNTGYPMVDAGMRELNTTGFMHNRVRMIVASFLCKHLLIDWRWGEAYFANKLLDFDLSANNGGWQWAAGSGTDAAPYFRIFNPRLQTEKFDKNFEYIKKWVPEYLSSTYPEPIVVHEEARQRCLEVYKRALVKE